MKRWQVATLVLASALLSHALSPAIAWAQAKAQVALGGLAGVTTASGLSGTGSAGDPLAFTGTTTAALSTSAAAPQFACSKTDATCQLNSATTDATTSSTVGAITLKATADITAADLLLDVQDSAGNHVATMTEAGAVTLGAASGVTALALTQGAFLSLKADGTNKIYSAASNNLIIHAQSSKNTYIDIGSGTGALLFNPDNAVDIGATSATRPKNVYVAGTVAAQAASGDGLTVVGGAYARITNSAGAPTGTDCDAAGEAGRIAIDTSNNRWYFCNGAAWQYTNEDVP